MSLMSRIRDWLTSWLDDPYATSSHTPAAPMASDDPTPEPDEADVHEMSAEEWAALVEANPSMGGPVDCTPGCSCMPTEADRLTDEQADRIWAPVQAEIDARGIRPFGISRYPRGGAL